MQCRYRRHYYYYCYIILLQCKEVRIISYSACMVGINGTTAGPSVDRFVFNTLPDLQECYSNCILESDLTHISV